MNRTALRLATLAVLTNGGAEPWPTLADDYVYDSRRDPIQDVHERLRRPVIVIRTDDDTRSNRGVGGSATIQQARMCRLLLEISVVSAIKDGDVWREGWPQTDPALEATLDMLEYQIENALFGLNPTWTQWWRSKFDRAMFGYTSTPEYSRDPMSLRLAARTLTFDIGLAPSCYPSWKFEGEELAPAAMPILLSDVISKILTDGSGDLVVAATQIRNILNGIGWPTEVEMPMLKRVPTRVVVGKEAL